MKIMNMSISNLEFLLNFQEIAKTKINPLEYRYKILKADKLYDNFRLYLTIKDTQEDKQYKIVLNDFKVTKNPFLSNKTLQNLMNEKYSKSSGLDYSYMTRYKKFIRSKIRKQLISIKSKQEKQQGEYDLKTITDALIQSLGIRRTDFTRRFRGKDLNSLILFSDKQSFLEMLDDTKIIKELNYGLYGVNYISKMLEDMSANIQQGVKYLEYPSFEKRLEFFMDDKNSVDYMVHLHDLKVSESKYK